MTWITQIIQVHVTTLMIKVLHGSLLCYRMAESISGYKAPVNNDSESHVAGHQVFGKEIQTPLTQPDHYLAHATVDPEEQSWIVSSRYMRPYVRKPEEHDGFWHAQTAECIASPKAKDQTLGSLASKYGLGTQYDPFRSSALEQCLGKPAT